MEEKIIVPKPHKKIPPPPPNIKRVADASNAQTEEKNKAVNEVANNNGVAGANSGNDKDIANANSVKKDAISQQNDIVENTKKQEDTQKQENIINQGNKQQNTNNTRSTKNMSKQEKSSKTKLNQSEVDKSKVLPLIGVIGGGILFIACIVLLVLL